MQVQGLTLPQIQIVRRITSSTLGLQPLPNREAQYTRQLSADGDVFEVDGLIDRDTLDRLFAASDQNNPVWVVDPNLGSFHAILEVEATWVVGDDAPSLETSP
jgi:hypothetical protein